jgi:(p)ppGpp synthase/HD superfamily hydrolase
MKKDDLMLGAARDLMYTYTIGNRKDGSLQVQHPIRVEKRVAEIAPPQMKLTSELFQVALLHDIIEDTVIEESELINRGFSLAVIDAVKLLTRKNGQPDKTYVRAICDEARRGSFAGLLAGWVKLADALDNLHPVGLNEAGGMARDRYIPTIAKISAALGLVRPQDFVW